MTAEETVTVTFALPASLARAIKAKAAEESKRTGYAVTASAVIRKACEREVGL